MEVAAWLGEQGFTLHFANMILKQARHSLSGFLFDASARAMDTTEQQSPEESNHAHSFLGQPSPKPVSSPVLNLSNLASCKSRKRSSRAHLPDLKRGQIGIIPLLQKERSSRDEKDYDRYYTRFIGAAIDGIIEYLVGSGIDRFDAIGRTLDAALDLVERARLAGRPPLIEEEEKKDDS
ncbi:MAG: hypothetical protein ACNS63_04340 [Candidatus Nitrospinota bacterium M3_3B_026]